MADIILNVEVRERIGTGGARAARREGLVPGVLYGGDKDPVAITDAGWYTFKHEFRNDGGVLAVDLSIVDSGGSVVNTWTLSDPSDVIGVTVGGNGYGWFSQNEFPFLAFDNTRLDVPVGPPTSKDECKKGGWETFNTPRTFKNQGDCVSYVQTGK